MSSDRFTYISASADQTCDLARSLSAELKPGDVLLLSGEIGAGKTHFARCLILASLIEAEDVPSPTYTLVQTYKGMTADIWHADLYRLSDISEIEELGLADAFTDAISLIEWPDRLGELAPASALHIQFDPGPTDDARFIRFNWTADRWAFLLKGEVDA